MSRQPLQSTSASPGWITPRRAADAPLASPRSNGVLTLADHAARSRQELELTPVLEEVSIQLACRELFKSYRKGNIGIPVLQGISLFVERGEFLAIVGQSGSGKSTLMHLLATLDQPDAGEIRFDHHRIDNIPSAARDMLRNRHFGMVFQFYHLLPEMTALENVLAPAMIAGGVLGYLRNRAAYRRRAYELLEMVGIGHRAKHKPRELSGGEMQRAAVARALMLKPKLLFADEPTGNLDRASGESIMRMLAELNDREKLTIVMVTHDPWIAGQADRTVKLVEGRIAQG
ncbi:MAG: ABC transporter ATP-binding protein [Planctomycetaceae bacterium]|uniref:P-loop containing nucleoside triphosphate hydrolase n=1 Tax=Lacipirellula limnantheis TaxID=2528024 RepID=A0A517TVV0_9BACT|nr:ABC transporter ATP-binding protein [Lacipirellula limnantheis]MBL9164710.1 ABC transporter ATP-binding protein [Planctomycetaceae bacterium]QDT72500.1 P-loop containing nucleoside triphosphate hydrolase [Lacipirellula limnantheis]